MKLPKVKVPRVYKRKALDMPAPRRPQLDNGDEAELLIGTVQDMTASKAEERFARALDKQKIQYYFRYTLGAPRGLPGWFELDFLPLKGGVFYPIEIDSLFTHRQKHKADILHDAKVLSELEKAGLPYFPKVTHIDGEAELADQEQADRTMKGLLA